MPAYADVLAADARWDLANFVVSLARTPPWEKGGSFGGAGFAQDLKPARQLPYPLGDVRPLPYANRPDRDLQRGWSVSRRRHARWLLSARILCKQEFNFRR